VSLGLTAIPPFAASLKEVLAGAESALIASKRAGKDRVTAHGVDQLFHAPESDVREILNRPGTIRVMAQRIVGPSGSGGVVHEFLVRGPKDSPLEQPSALFSAARHANVLCAADLLCLRRCIAATRHLTVADCVHVNIFPSTFLDTPADALQSILVQSGGPRVALELSEQELIGAPGMLLPTLRAMREAGVLIALDDVGFGRSSLETLVVLEPDIVKIDRSVVQGVADDPGRRRILERLLGCLTPLGPQIIAEGIETEADARVVADLGVEFAQGFLLGAVVAVGDSNEWLRC
jgi:EAL domain-containing protein (putative c-di-GMP-specific phosphodiesterase class I)